MRRRLVVGGPLDGQYVDVCGREFQIALPAQQWWSVSEPLDPYAPVPFRTGIYRPKLIEFGTDGALVQMEVMAYYGTNQDEGK